MIAKKSKNVTIEHPQTIHESEIVKQNESEILEPIEIKDISQDDTQLEHTAAVTIAESQYTRKLRRL